MSGQLYRISYKIDKSVDELSIGEVYEDYVQALQKQDIPILAKGLFSNSNVKGDVGGSKWIGIVFKDNMFTGNSAGKYFLAGTSTSGGTFSIVAKLRKKDSYTHIAIYGERHSEDFVVVQVDILEEKAADIGYVLADADYIKSEIESKGFVSIYGINFDFDSSVIKADSKPALDEISEYLKKHPKINFYVVGHTDMKGTLGYNLKLSKDRAAAVVEKLAKTYGIKRDRLVPDGVGPLAPKNNNTTDDGRSANRRVDLVQKI